GHSLADVGGKVRAEAGGDRGEGVGVAPGRESAGADAEQPGGPLPQLAPAGGVRVPPGTAVQAELGGEALGGAAGTRPGVGLGTRVIAGGGDLGRGAVVASVVGADPELGLLVFHRTAEAGHGCSLVVVAAVRQLGCGANGLR